MKSNKKNLQAFTLIEVMVVIVILGILASIVIPHVMQRPEQARIIKAKQDILALENALELYQLDNGIYPSTEQGLQALIHQPEIAPLPSHWQLYLKRLPIDPWGHPYQYLNPGTHGEIDIFSYGNNKKTKTNNKEKFIGNWNA